MATRRGHGDNALHVPKLHTLDAVSRAQIATRVGTKLLYYTRISLK